MDSKHRHHGWLIVCFTIFTIFSVLLLMGAVNDSQVGRYRMSIITRNNFTDIFVIDTVTGVVKYVGADEGKPFAEIKGK